MMGALNGPSLGVLNCTRTDGNISRSCWCTQVHLSRVEISDLLGCLALPRLALLGKASRLVQQKFISLLDNLGNLNKVSLTISADLSLLHEQGHGGTVRAPSCSSASTPSSEIGAPAGRIPAKSSRFPSN